MMSLILLLSYSLAAPDQARSQAASTQFTRAGITCTETVSPTPVPLTGEVRLSLSAAGRAPLVIEPVNSANLRGWQFRASDPATITELPDGRQQWRQSFRLAPEKPGDLPLVAPAIRGRAGNRQTSVAIDWPPLSVRVTTTIGHVELDEARGITGPEPAPPTPPPIWMDERTWAAGIVVIAVVAAILAGRGTAPAANPEPPAAVWAAGELDRLNRLDPADPAAADALPG